MFLTVKLYGYQCIGQCVDVHIARKFLGILALQNLKFWTYVEYSKDQFVSLTPLVGIQDTDMHITYTRKFRFHYLSENIGLFYVFEMSNTKKQMSMFAQSYLRVVPLSFFAYLPIYYENHCQVIGERGVCELAHFFIKIYKLHIYIIRPVLQSYLQIRLIYHIINTNVQSFLEVSLDNL